MWKGHYSHLPNYSSIISRGQTNSSDNIVDTKFYGIPGEALFTANPTSTPHILLKCNWHMLWSLFWDLIVTVFRSFIRHIKGWATSPRLADLPTTYWHPHSHYVLAIMYFYQVVLGWQLRNLLIRENYPTVQTHGILPIIESTISQSVLRNKPQLTPAIKLSLTNSMD